MSKTPIYLAARGGARPSREVIKNATEHFISTGSVACSAALAVEIANFSLEKGWTTAIHFTENVVVIKRIID